MNPSTAFARQPAFLSLPLCRVNLTTVTHAHPTHQDTSLYYSCVYSFLMRQSALRHPCSEGCLFEHGPPISTVRRRGERDLVFLANRTVNLQSYVFTNVCAKVCVGRCDAKQWGHLHSCRLKTRHVHIRRFKFNPPFCPPSEHHASVEPPTP